jgi:hypothetical protein
MSNIFISYRRTDSSGYAGWLYTLLSEHFTQSRVFFDIDSIPAGKDFVSVINQYLQRSKVILVMIGSGWLVKDQYGRTRLSDPEDHVRLEIVAALKRRRATVIPVLVQGAQMPQPHEVPQDLVPLLRRNAFELRERSYKSDAEHLIGIIEEEIGKPARATAAKKTGTRARSKSSDQSTPKPRKQKPASTTAETQTPKSRPGSQQPVTTAETRPKNKAASPRAEGTSQATRRPAAKSPKQPGASGPVKHTQSGGKPASTKDTGSGQKGTKTVTSHAAGSPTGRSGTPTGTKGRTPQAPKTTQGAVQTTPKRGGGSSAPSRTKTGSKSSSGGAKPSQKAGSQTPKRAAAKSTGSNSTATKGQTKGSGSASPRNSGRGGGGKG